jgi:hypothetical protein
MAILRAMLAFWLSSFSVSICFMLHQVMLMWLDDEVFVNILKYPEPQ